MSIIIADLTQLAYGPHLQEAYQTLHNHQAMQEQQLNLQELSNEDNAIRPLDYYASDGYIAQSWSTKQTQLMAEVRANTNSIAWPNVIKQGQLMLESMKPTLYTKGDVMPHQGFPLFNRRIKPIHPVGVIGKVSLVSNGNHPFTGIFEGADSGIVRLASAWEPTTNH